MASDAPWQYYNKYKTYLRELKHPFRHRIDFYYDKTMSVNPDFIRQYAAVGFFYHDPLYELYPDVYAYAKRLEAICQEAGIPLINKPDALSNTVKSVQLNLLRQGGFQVAKAYPFSDVNELEKIPSNEYPIFIRIEAGHDSQGEFVQGPYKSFQELSEAFVPYNFKHRSHHQGMVAIQFIETAKLNGLYAKYRCFVTKQAAIKAYAYYSTNWYIHYDIAVKNEETEAWNYIYASTPFTDEEIKLFLRANETLGLDFCAYDYSLKTDGSIVLWEGNPHPGISDMTESEPIRTRFVNLLSNYYARFLPPLPLKYKWKLQLRQWLR